MVPGDCHVASLLAMTVHCNWCVHNRVNNNLPYSDMLQKQGRGAALFILHFN